MGILGPFPLALGKLKILIMGVDNFTKWIDLNLSPQLQKKEFVTYIMDESCASLVFQKVSSETMVLNSPTPMWSISTTTLE